MPNRVTTTQGTAWDQIAKDRCGSELQMGTVLSENITEADTLLFSGETTVTVPENVEAVRVRSLPPWERM